MPVTQRLTKTITAATAGTGSCIFPAPAQGKVLTGTIAVPDANAGASFSITVGLDPTATGQGGASMGPVQSHANEQVTVTGTNLVPGTIYTVVWTCSLTDEGLTPAVVPIPTAVSVLAVEAVDLLLSQSLSIAQSFPVTSSQAITNAEQPYQTIEVSAFSVSIPISVVAVGVQVSNATKGTFSGWQTSEYQPIVGQEIDCSSLFFPVACDTGDRIFVLAYPIIVGGIAGAPPLPISLAVYGHTALVQPTRLRSDGRLPPLGRFCNTASLVAAGSTALVAAPGANIRFMLGMVTLSNNSAGGAANALLECQVNGVTIQVLSSIAVGGGAPVAVFHDGLLTDPNVAITLVQNGAGISSATIVGDYCL